MAERNTSLMTVARLSSMVSEAVIRRVMVHSVEELDEAEIFAMF